MASAPKYSTEALSTGEGRDGHVTVTDSPLELDMAIPKEMGGSGDGANPEQLFAAGYASCYHSALKGVARGRKVAIDGSSVGARVDMGDDGQGGFELSVRLEVVIPELDYETAQNLADAAHQVCPYSKATRGNIEVSVVVSDD